MLDFYARYYLIVNLILIICKSEKLTNTEQSFVELSLLGYEYFPIDFDSSFIRSKVLPLFVKCSQLCHQTIECRIFDYDEQSYRCRLFEGEVNAMGSIVTSSLTWSRVGYVLLQSGYYLNYGRPCSECQYSRYLICRNNSCQCPDRTYYNGLICKSEKVLGQECSNNSECRADRNYVCLPRMQCGPTSVLAGVTVAGYGNGTGGSDLNGLRYPVALFLDSKNVLYISDYSNNRILKSTEDLWIWQIVAGTGIRGSSDSQVSQPCDIFVDLSSNLYISDTSNWRIMMWPPNSSVGIRLAGNGTSGSSLNMFGQSYGIIVDKHGDMFVADLLNHRVVKWKQNATSGVIVAGTGFLGNSTFQLNRPTNIYLDELKQYLYVSDLNNHRIQRYDLSGASDPITVVGGNGAGSDKYQLNKPCGFAISKKTGDIYVADMGNHRIQRWSAGASYGVTIAGIAGSYGANSTMLYSPYSVILNANETFLYGADSGNNRVQRFKLI